MSTLFRRDKLLKRLPQGDQRPSLDLRAILPWSRWTKSILGLSTMYGSTLKALTRNVNKHDDRGLMGIEIFINGDLHTLLQAKFVQVPVHQSLRP
jgi:hypothetical protein